MAVLSLSAEQHGELMEGVAMMRESLDNIETALANRIIDTDDVDNDLNEIERAIQTMRAEVTNG